MSDVGDVLELLHGAFDRWQTARFTARHWNHVARSRTATERWIAQSSGSVQRYVEDPTVEPETTEHEQRIWIAKPDLRRQEFNDYVSVQRGSTFWSHTEHHGYVTNENDPDIHGGDPLQDFAAHLDPSTVLPQIAIESIERSGESIVVRARSRGMRHGPGLPPGADEHALTIDAERGVVLRVESFVDGELFARIELVDAVFDEPIDDAVFTLTAPPGNAFHSPLEDFGRVTIEEAAERAGFPVFAIAELPEGLWRMHVHYQRGFDRAPEHLNVLYHRSDGRQAIQVSQHGAGSDLPWSRMIGADNVTVERDGTTITLQSEHFGEDTLRSLADAMVRV